MNGKLKAVVLLALAWGLATPAAAPASSELRVSLGDSYSSGEGAPPYDPKTEFGALLFGGNGCHRSELAWPRLLHVPESMHLACSGAKTVHFFEPQKKGWRVGRDGTSQLAQLEALPGAQSIARVLVTIGGNDVGFSGIIIRCLSPRGVPVLPCLRKLHLREFPRLHGVVFPDVVEALVAVRAAAPGAEVLQVGYPDSIPPLPAKLEKCGTWLDRGERERLPMLEEALDATLATAAQAAGVEYLSIRDVAKGHGICDKDPWINPVSHRRALAPKGMVHPNEEGHRKIEARVKEALRTGQGIADPSSPPPSSCESAEEVAVVVDDSGAAWEAGGPDPRVAALKHLISAPANTARTLGAIEFGADAGPTFESRLVGANRETMLAALKFFDGDGFEAGGAGGLESALRESARSQPHADARLLLVGKRTAVRFGSPAEDAPRTYVIGLDASPLDDGGLAAQAMSELARQTGGVYFPLKRTSWDKPEEQMARVPAIVDSIGALLDCPTALEL